MWSLTKIELHKIWRGRLPIYLFLAYAVLLFFHISTHTWSGFLSEKLSWFTMVLGMIGFGILSSWVFGREYQDQTFKDLLALPISRNEIVGAKLIALLITEVLLTLVSVGWLFAVGFGLQLTDFASAHLASLLIHFGVSMIAAIALTCVYPLVASLSHGLLAPLSFSFGALIIGKLMAAETIGHYFPWSIPMLAVGQPSALNGVSWLGIVLVVALSVWGTMHWWTKADHTD